MVAKARTVSTAPADEDMSTVDDVQDDVQDVPTVGEVDVNALIKQLQEQAAAQQKHIDALLAEKGIPSDPVEAQIQALQQHINAQHNANPWHSASYDALRAHVDNLDSKGLTDKKALKAVRLVDAVRAKHPGHELAYVGQLANDLYTMTLDDEDE